MITKEQALALKPGTVIYLTSFFTTGSKIVNLDKVTKWRINGQAKVWKTKPDQFQIPLKHGLYDFGYLTESNAALFSLEEPKKETFTI